MNLGVPVVESDIWAKGGDGGIEMAKKVIEMGGEIRMESKVTGITLEGNAVKEVKINDSETLQGDYFISSMPLKDLYFAFGKENVPEQPFEVATALVYRDFITVGLLLKKLLIKNTTKTKTIDDIVPDTWIYVQEREVKVGRLQIFNNWSPYLVKEDGTLWIGMEYFANEGDELWSMEKEPFIEMAINELASINVIDKEDVLDATQIKVKKAYPAYFDSYKDIQVVIDHLNTIDNLYCVGRNGQHRYNNMDHSMLTAIDAAKAIVDPASFDKKDIWKVNTEKDYAETKKAE